MDTHRLLALLPPPFPYMYIRSYIIVMTDTLIHVYEADTLLRYVRIHTYSGNSIVYWRTSAHVPEYRERVCIYVPEYRENSISTTVYTPQVCMSQNRHKCASNITYLYTYNTATRGKPRPPTHYAAIPRLAIVCEYSISYFPIFKCTHYVSSHMMFTRGWPHNDTAKQVKTCGFEVTLLLLLILIIPFKQTP